MKLNDREAAWGEFSALIGAAAIAFIWYCERLQFIPPHSKTFLGTLLAVFFGSGIILFLLYCLLRKGIREIKKREWLPFVLISMVIAVVVMVWFPVPDTGIYTEHTLEIRALPNGEGEFLPVTLTWLHREAGDIPLPEVTCEGNCSSDNPFGPTIIDESGTLRWQGKTGDLITIEFISGIDQGIAEISWDGNITVAALNNGSMTRLSYDHAFPPSNGLPEFIAVFVLLFLLCFAGVVTFVKLLPLWKLRFFAAVCYFLFAVFRILQFRTVEGPLEFIDSEFYLGLSRLNYYEIISGAAYCRTEWHCLSRPILIPLLYKLCQQNTWSIIIMQTGISIISWCFFSWHAAKLCRNSKIQKIVTILTLGLACIPNVTRWDAMIMSESLSISTAMLLMGSLFWLVRPTDDKNWKVLPAAITLLSALAFSISRDSAVWTVMLIVIVLLIISHLRSRQWITLGTAGILAVICFAIMQTTGDRWIYSFENVLFNRLLRDPQTEQYLVESGMPKLPGIETLYGTEHLMASPLFNSNEYEPLRTWIHEEGLKTYFAYLLKTPLNTLKMTWRSGFEAEAFEKISYTFTPFGFKQLLPDPIIKFFSCNLPGLIYTLLAIVGIFKSFHKPAGERFVFPVVFILSAYLLSTATFLADEYELDRHMMVIIIMMKASVWPLICMIYEEIKGVRNGY